MNVLDWILLGGIGVAVFVAVRYICKKRKNGDCIGCNGSCATCMATKKYEKIVLNLVHAQIPLS